MSSFLRRLFGRSRLDGPRRRTTIPLPAAPDPDDLFDWSPRARPETERPLGAGIEEVPRSEEHQVGDGPTVAPISEALSQFQRADQEPPSGRRPSVPDVETPGPPSMPPAPPPPTKPAQIRLLMGDGTVVVVSGDPELERRIGYLAENLLAPLLGPPESPAPPPPPPAPAEASTETEPQHEPLPVLASVGAQGMAPVAVEVEQVEEIEDSGRTLPGGWPQMRLVFTDGSEASLPPDQEIVDRLSYVIANLLPARPPA